MNLRQTKKSMTEEKSLFSTPEGVIVNFVVRWLIILFLIRIVINKEKYDRKNSLFSRLEGVIVNFVVI